MSIGLYEREVDGAFQFLVYSYSTAAGAEERVAYLRQALIQIVGLEPVSQEPDWIRFPCQARHERALRRVFLDLCKLDTGDPLEPKPLAVFDKKADCKLTAKALGQGTYELAGELESDISSRRAQATARGLIKLCEMAPVEDSENRIVFPCKMDHDRLVASLLYRAQNVRAAMKEEEMSSSRGVMSAPSQQV
jgi:hypothetical protein